MYKLLIVDDEVWIRERLRYTIDWESIGIQVIGEACDGEEALELCTTLEPDIIITDIRMPCIDGLEFIKRLREGKSNAKVIIISGYSDFEYAQRAIKLGAFDYVLKPVEDDVLLGILTSCVNEIALEKNKEALIREATKQVKENMPLIKEKFLINLVGGYFNSEEDILEELNYLGIGWPRSRQVCFVIKLDQMKDMEINEQWDTHLLQFVVCNIAKDFVNKLGGGEAFYSQTGEVICLIFSDTEGRTLARQVMSISNAIRKIVYKATGYSVTIGIGRACSSLMGINTSYSEAREALQYGEYLGKNKIYDIQSINTQYKPNYYKFNNMEALLNNIKMGNREAALSVLQDMVEGSLKAQKEICPMDLKFIYMDITNSLFKAVLEANASISDFSQFSYKFFEQLNGLHTIDEFHLWIKEMICKMIDLLDKHKNTKRRKIIEKAVDYVNKNYKDCLTLNSLADKLFLNPSYFCKIFKEEMGESFTKYLMNLRVEKAKELMEDPTMKIYEVAERVGYDDVQYFTKMFKAIQGVTPMQYREKIK